MRAECMLSLARVNRRDQVKSMNVHDNTVLSINLVALPSLAHALQVGAAPSG